MSAGGACLYHQMHEELFVWFGLLLMAMRARAAMQGRGTVRMRELQRVAFALLAQQSPFTHTHQWKSDIFPKIFSPVLLQQRVDVQSLTFSTSATTAAVLV